MAVELLVVVGLPVCLEEQRRQLPSTGGHNDIPDTNFWKS